METTISYLFFAGTKCVTSTKVEGHLTQMYRNLVQQTRRGLRIAVYKVKTCNGKRGAKADITKHIEELAGSER